ncbi:hypothetical protein EUX98_g6211 [Antrodiella citrinella]|uniref:DUF6533 domain-containing protein n=1 Tax=Antrodiella citrinella TaxID=2447956 RepID=A0A4S4MPP4_9APHY|nr:hypothetical protein EUX98_g6211 [Antrodiella citrinella]
MIFENGGVTASVASEAQILRYCNVAAVAFLVYDLLIHFGDEVELIWKSRNTWVKWIYIYLRYYGAVIIGILVLQGNTTIRFTPQSCLNWFIAESVISNSIILVTETMLLIRVWAIYGKNKMILYILCAASTAEAITVLVTTIKAFQTAKVSLDLGCILVYVPPILSAAWAASLGFQTIIFGLTIGRWLTHLIITKQLGRRSVMYVLVRDGGWAYGVMFVVFLVNLLTFRLSTSPLASVVFRWAMAMASFTVRLPHITS